MSILADHLHYKWDIDLTQSTAPTHVNKVIETLFPERVVRHPIDSYPIIQETELLHFLDIYGTNSHPLVEATVTRTPPLNFGMHHIYAFRPSSMTDSQYLERKIALYQTIACPVALLEDVQLFAKAQTCGTLESVIGCHIRHTDNFFDPKKCQMNLNTSIETFAERLQHLAEPTFLLCSDNPDAKVMISRVMPAAKIIFANVCSDTPCLWQSLYEMLLLGQTAHLVGSMSSTFSYEACFWRGINLEVFRNNKWQFYPISQYRDAQSPKSMNSNPAAAR
jgi:hypothetical protein